MMSLTRKILKKFLIPIRKIYLRHLNIVAKRSYHTWALKNESAIFNDPIIAQDKKVSIVVPVYNTNPEHLREMIYSVVNQNYENWELILANASDNKLLRKNVTESLNIDSRIKIVKLESNSGISENTNAGLKEARGEFIAFLDHDDTLHPRAIYSLVAAAEMHSADLVYSDEDKVTHDGTFYFGPHCKPDWSPQLLENVNYINHLTMVRAQLIKEVGGLRKECDGAQDYDFLLRITDKPGVNVIHVPRILYHWRAADTSTASDISNKTYIFKAGEKALADHFERKEICAQSKTIENKPGFYKTIYPNVTAFTIVVGEVDIDKQAACFNWLLDLTKIYKDRVELVIGEWFRPYINRFHEMDISLVKNDGDENYMLRSVKQAKHDIIIVFVDGAMPRNNTDLYDLASVAKYSGVDIVQPIIVGQDGTIFDAGLVNAPYGLQPLFKGRKYAESTFFGNTDWVRNISAVSNSVFATSKQTFLEQHNNNQSKKNHALTSILWAHLDFEWRSILAYQDNQQPYFNSQLGQSMFEIIMRSSTWDDNMERVRE